MNKAKRQRRAQLIRFSIAGLWAVLVAAILLWQTVNYESVMSVLAEWQFNAIGRYYPTFSYLLVALLLILPAVLLAVRWKTPRSEAGFQRAATVSARRFGNVLLGITGGLLLATIVTLLSLLTLPSNTGPVQQLSLDESIAILPREGRTTLTSSILYDRTAGFDEHLLVARRSTRFAPMVAGGSNVRDLQYFVELPAATTPFTRRATRTMTGVLKRGGLPGEVIRLYRYAGHRIEEPYFVLFADTASIRWPKLMIAAQLAIATLIAALLWFWQRTRIRKLAQAPVANQEPQTP